MTPDEAKTLLRGEDRIKATILLECVGLTEKERMVLKLRHFEGLTQQETIERIPYLYANILKIPLETSLERHTYSLNSIQNWEHSGLKKCAKCWGKLGIK